MNDKNNWPWDRELLGAGPCRKCGTAPQSGNAEDPDLCEQCFENQAAQSHPQQQERPVSDKPTKITSMKNEMANLAEAGYEGAQIALATEAIEVLVKEARRLGGPKWKFLVKNNALLAALEAPAVVVIVRLVIGYWPEKIPAVDQVRVVTNLAMKGIVADRLKPLTRKLGKVFKRVAKRSAELVQGDDGKGDDGDGKAQADE